MKQIVQVLRSLLKHSKSVVKRVPPNMVVSVVRQDASIFCRNVARQFRITVRGVEYSFEKLSKEDRVVVEELVDYATRLVQNYLENHEAYSDDRERGGDIEQILLSHASELLEAGKSAVVSQIGSHAYNDAFGKPDTSKTVFSDENMLKTATITVINETLAELDEVSNSVQRQRRSS